MNLPSFLTPELSARVCATLLHSLWQAAALAAGHALAPILPAHAVTRTARR
jgi:hypothetical protein